MTSIPVIAMRRNVVVRKKARNADAIAGSMKFPARSCPVSKWTPIISTTGTEYGK